MLKIFILNCCTIIMFCSVSCNQKRKNSQINYADDIYMLVGTYTSGSSNGIYVYRFNQKDGSAEYLSSVDVENPSYLVVSKDERFVYSVSENRTESAYANAFSFNKQTGTLTYLNRQLTTGANPCYINTDFASKFVITANYSGGNVSVFPISDDGMLLPVSQVFDFESIMHKETPDPKSHLHSVVFSPDQKFIFAADLGKDKIHKFVVNNISSPFIEQGVPDAFELEAGSGPRHMVFHPNEKYAYMLNELSGNVTAFDYDDGNLNAIQYIAADTTSVSIHKGSADIHVSPDGKFLYASTRVTSNGIAIFKINEADGKLSFIDFQPTGIHPRNFIITPNGQYLLVANRDSNNIQIFTIDKNIGLLRDTGKQLDINMPVCLKFISISR